MGVRRIAANTAWDKAPLWSDVPGKWKSLSRVRLFVAMNSAVHGILQARTLEWAAFPFSRGSSQPRDRTQASRIAGGLFTSWAIRAAQREGTNPKQSLKVLMLKDRPPELQLSTQSLVLHSDSPSCANHLPGGTPQTHTLPHRQRLCPHQHHARPGGTVGLTAVWGASGVRLEKGNPKGQREVCVCGGEDWGPGSLRGDEPESKPGGCSVVFASAQTDSNSFSDYLFKKKKSYLCIVALQCCVSFCCIAKQVSYMYTRPLFSGFPSFLGHHRAASRFPCSVRYTLYSSIQ